MELEVFQQGLLNPNFGPASVNRYFNVIRHFFRKCEEWKFIKENPTKNLKNLKAPKKKKRLWTRAEVKQFFTLAPDWLQDIAFFIYETGVRRGEAVSLVWSDFDFDRNVVRVVSIKGGIPVERFIPMTVSMREWFLQKKNKNPFLSKPDKNVFVDRTGKKLIPTNVSTGMNRVVRKMDGKGLGLHGMRHTILTELAQSNVSLEKVKQLAGHSSLKTTEQYLHINFEDTRSVLETLNEKRDVVRPFSKKLGSSGS